MPADVNREEFIVLLDKLGRADDAEVLGAARALHAKVTAAGLSWNDLLASDKNDDDDDDTPAYGGGPGNGEIDDTVLVAPNADHGVLSEADKIEARSLIDAIGAMKISDTTRDELADYAADLLDNRMEQMDLRYLRALKKRLDA
jgi:hypothetical protein